MSSKSLREALAAAGVAASLIFVGLEIRQNNQLAEAAAYQELGLATSGNWLTTAANADMNHLLWESKRHWRDSTWWEERTQPELDQLASLEVGTMRAYEVVYTQVQLGLLRPEALERMGWTTLTDAGPSYRWPQTRGSMDTAFADHMERAWDITP